MRSIRPLIPSMVFLALCASGAYQPVFGQTDDEPFPEIQIRARDYGSKEIRASELGEFLMDNYVIVAGEGRSEPMAVWLRVEVMSRERGLLGSTDSRRIEIEPGNTYRASAFIPQIADWVPQMDRWIRSPESRVVLRRGRTDQHGQGRFPPGCTEAPVAITVWVAWEGKAFVDAPAHTEDCLNVEG